MTKLILLRHGQSKWNKMNLFTGWVDIDLSQKGIDEALEAGEAIKDYPIDVVFTSTLIRAQMTASLAMSRHSKKMPLVYIHTHGKEKEWGTDTCVKEALDQCIPTHISWHLNERYYGELQGMNKDTARKEFGEEQVHIWRRSFDIPPPQGESLELTAKRTIPYFENTVLPYLKEGKNVLISAHGNSLRSIVMFLDQLSKEEVLKLEIPTGHPLVYEFKKSQFKKVI